MPGTRLVDDENNFPVALLEKGHEFPFAETVKMPVHAVGDLSLRVVQYPYRLSPVVLVMRR